MKKFASILGIGFLLVTFRQAEAALYLSETFSYGDGELTNVSAGAWVGFSGTLPINVLSGQASLTSANSQDAGRNFDGGTAHSNDTLFASFDLTLTSLPTGSGGTAGNNNGTYFFLFKDATVSGFRSRVFVTTNGAAAGTFRIGIANSASTVTNAGVAFVASDLSLSTSYKIVVSITQTGAAPSSRLWLNPTLESDPNVLATDAINNTLLPLTQIALRQATATVGAGVDQIDNILVGSTFADVIPEPSTIVLVGAGLAGLFVLRRRRS